MIFIDSIVDNLIRNIGYLIIFIISLLACCINHSGKDGSGDIPARDDCARFTGGTPIQDKIAKKYKKYKIPKRRKSFEEFCYPKAFAIQPQQAFLGDYFAPSNNKTSPKALLAFHKIGSGKSCVMIQVAERWTDEGRPLILIPASLIPGFRDELRGKCSDIDFTNDNIKKSNRAIDRKYNIMSYNKFLESPPRHAPIMMIDECQNLLNESGNIYAAVRNFIQRNDNMPVLLLTGTPVFDNPNNLVALSRLLRLDADSAQLSPKYMAELLNDKVSFFAGAPQYTFPKTEVIVDICRMSKLQTRWYQSEVEAEKSIHGRITLHNITNNFFIKSRQRANIIYPSGLVGEAALQSLTQSLITSSLGKYSCKYAKMITRLKKGRLAFIYVEFTELYGIASITKCLDALGFSNYFTSGPGRRRYAIWSGQQSMTEKAKIRNIFNDPSNNDASQLQFIIGSPAIKEGVNLMRIREVHIISPYWNHSRLEQIYGRAVRFCSHKTLPIRERTVNIYIYAAVTHNYRAFEEVTPENSIDLYMLQVADEKREMNEPYVQMLMDVAIDKKLFQ